MKTITVRIKSSGRVFLRFQPEAGQDAQSVAAILRDNPERFTVEIHHGK